MGLWWLSLLGVQERFTDREVKLPNKGRPGASGTPEKKREKKREKISKRLNWEVFCLLCWVMWQFDGRSGWAPQDLRLRWPGALWLCKWIFCGDTLRLKNRVHLGHCFLLFKTKPKIWCYPGDSSIHWESQSEILGALSYTKRTGKGNETLLVSKSSGRGVGVSVAFLFKKKFFLNFLRRRKKKVERTAQDIHGFRTGAPVQKNRLLKVLFCFGICDASRYAFTMESTRHSVHI